MTGTPEKNQQRPARISRPASRVPEQGHLTQPMLSLRYTLPSFSSRRVALRTLARAALLSTLSMSDEIAATCALIWLMSSAMIVYDFRIDGLQIVAVPTVQIEEFKPDPVGGRSRGVVRILRGLGTDVAVLASVRTVRVGHRRSVCIWSPRSVGVEGEV